MAVFFTRSSAVPHFPQFPVFPIQFKDDKVFQSVSDAGLGVKPRWMGSCINSFLFQLWRQTGGRNPGDNSVCVMWEGCNSAAWDLDWKDIELITALPTDSPAPSPAVHPHFFWNISLTHTQGPSSQGRERFPKTTRSRDSEHHVVGYTWRARVPSVLPRKEKEKKKKFCLAL